MIHGIPFHGKRSFYTLKTVLQNELHLLFWLSIYLTWPWDAQILNKILFWVFLGSVWMKLTFKVAK